MTEAEAKRIIREDPQGSIFTRLDALEVAYDVLGPDVSITELYRWAEDDNQRSDSMAK